MIFQTKSIGIDVQPDSVRVAVASTQGGRTKVLNLTVRELPEAPEQETKAATASIIKEVFREQGLDGDIAVACLPAAFSLNRFLTTPVTDSGKIRQTLKFQIEPQIPYPIEHVVSDYVPLRKTDEGTDVLAIAVTKDFVSDRLELLEMAGVDPQILTLDELALTDFYSNPYDFSPDKVTALLHLDRRNSFLGFFWGEKLIGYRNLDGLPVDTEPALKKMVKDVQRSLLTYQPPLSATGELGTLCVCGSGAEGLRGMLQQSIREFPVRTVEFNESALAEIPAALIDLAGECQLAIALARVGLEGGANAINLRQEEYAPVSALSRLKPNALFSLFVLALTLVAWFGSVFAETRHQSRELELLNREMMSIFASTLPSVRSPEHAQMQIKQEQEKFKSLRNYSSEYVSPLDVLSQVNAANPERNITLGDLAISDNVLRMTGEVGSFDDINVFQGRLQTSPLLSEVTIDSATKSEKGEKINFRIRARITREPARAPETVSTP